MMRPRWGDRVLAVPLYVEPGLEPIDGVVCGAWRDDSVDGVVLQDADGKVYDIDLRLWEVLPEIRWRPLSPPVTPLEERG